MDRLWENGEGTQPKAGVRGWGVVGIMCHRLWNARTFLSILEIPNIYPVFSRVGFQKPGTLFTLGWSWYWALGSGVYLLITRYTERKWPKIDQHFSFYQSHWLNPIGWVSKEVHLLCKECIVPREPLCALYDLFALGVNFFYMGLETSDISAVWDD